MQPPLSDLEFQPSTEPAPNQTGRQPVKDAGTEFAPTHVRTQTRRTALRKRLVHVKEHAVNSSSAASPTPVATPSPAPSPSGTQTHRHTPGMPMPAASPSPEQKMNMPMPTASPSPNSMGQMEGTHGMASMDMGPLVVVNGDDIGIRVGSSDTNVSSPDRR